MVAIHADTAEGSWFESQTPSHSPISDQLSNSPFGRCALAWTRVALNGPLEQRNRRYWTFTLGFVERFASATRQMTPTPRRARFDLHAGLVIRAGHRDRLERVCRYALRPPLAQERLAPDQ